jgi:hypothetical protein
MKGGIALLLGKPEEKKPEESGEESLAKEAFAALQDGDEEGFVQAFLGAVRACANKAGDEGYEPDEDDEE